MASQHVLKCLHNNLTMISFIYLITIDVLSFLSMYSYIKFPHQPLVLLKKSQNAACHVSEKPQHFSVLKMPENIKVTFLPPTFSHLS